MKRLLLNFYTLIIGCLFCLATSTMAQTITTTQTDEIINIAGDPAKADPLDTIRYTVTIMATGAANNVQLNVTPDALTTFVGSTGFRTSPVAIDDGLVIPYNCIGNVGITVPDGGSDLLANDFDDNIPGLTVTPVTNAATTNGGTITIFANGSFNYMPPPGFEGTDTYTYTLNDVTQAGPGAPTTDMATINITVSEVVWFVDENAGSNGDGRLGTPFSTLPNFVSGAADETEDIIFLYSPGSDYTGGITLLNNQKLIGQGATASLASAAGLTVPTFSNALPATNGTRPTVVNATAGGDGITLASGNTIRGLNLGNCAVYGIQHNGATGTLTISELDINNTTGGAVDIAPISGVSTLAVTIGSISTGGGLAPDYGINLSNIGGSFTVTGSTTLSDSKNEAIFIGGSTVNVSFAAITISGSGTAADAMELQSMSGTFTATGTTTINAPAVGGGHSLHIIGGTGALNFAAIDINGRRDKGIRIAGGSRNITTGTVDIDNANSVAATVLEINTPTGGTISFGATTINVGGVGSNGIDIQSSSAIVSFASGSAVSNSTAAEINVNLGAANVTYDGTVSSTAGGAVSVTSRTGGTVDLQGTINSTGASIGIAVGSNSGGATINFSGGTKTITSSTANGVSLTSNTGAFINFTGGGLVINTTTGTGFNATGGGTVTVQGAGNTITSTTGTALNVASTTIGASNLTFQSISKNGGTNGIVLNSTGSSGGLTVTGTGGAGSGGTIQNCTGVGVSLTTTSSTNLSWMNIQAGGDDGINGSSVTGITLANCTITNNGNSTTDEGIEFDNLLGTSSITNSSITNNAHNNFVLDNTSSTLTSLTISGSTFEGHNNAGSFGNHGFLFEARLTALVTAVNITGSTFRNNKSIGMQVITGDNATISSFIVSGCTFSDTGTGNSQEIAADFSIAQTSDMTYQFLNNTLTGHNSHAFNTFTAAGAGTTGTLTGTIEGNTIGIPATIDSGSKIGNGMRININGDAIARIKVNNNTIHQIPTGRGIECIARNGTGGASFIVTNNTITTPTGTASTGCGAGVLCPLAPIHVQTNCVTVCNSACSVVSGNTAYDPTTVPGGAGSEFSVQLVETGASALTYEGNTMLTALQNLTNANPACVTKSVSGAVAVVAASTCPTP